MRVNGRCRWIRLAFVSTSTRPARPKKGPQASRRSRGERTSKLYLSGDAVGNVGWVLTSGQAGDCFEAAGLLTPWLAPAREVVADTAYDSDALRGLIAAAGAIAVTPPSPRRRHVPRFDPCAHATILNKLPTR